MNYPNQSNEIYISLTSSYILMTNNKKDFLSQAVKNIEELMEKEDRKDPEFRALIAGSEAGALLKYMTHDPKLNPNARPYKTSKDESLAYGQLFVQYIALAGLRGVNVEEAIKLALDNWKEADWRKVKAQSESENFLYGIVGNPGYRAGPALVDPTLARLSELDGSQIYITRNFESELRSYFPKAIAIVTDNGGKTSHAATLAREFGMPCIVGTGNATERIKDGQLIELDATDPEKGKINLNFQYKK